MVICTKPTANIIPQGKKPGSIPIKIRNKKVLSTIPFLFDILLETRDRALREGNENALIGNEEIKLFLFADYMRKK